MSIDLAAARVVCAEIAHYGRYHEPSRLQDAEAQAALLLPAALDEIEALRMENAQLKANIETLQLALQNRIVPA